MLLTLRPIVVRSQVQLDHDSAFALEVLVWLVNTDDRRTGIDGLTTPQVLVDLVADRGISGAVAGDKGELRAVRRLRSRLRRIFDLADDGDRDEAVDGLNALIADTRPVPRLVEHDDEPLHLHFTAADAPLDQRLGAEMAIALAIVVRDGGPERLRVCETTGCGRVLVDLSKNRSRRYCDAQCANRQHVAAYRRRRALAG
jgi:predicted RNA-binding Zn ribbon-like protein